MHSAVSDLNCYTTMQSLFHRTWAKRAWEHGARVPDWHHLVNFPTYAQQVDEMHWKLQCLQPAFVNFSPQQHPTKCHPTDASKVEPIGLQSFALRAIFTWPLTSWPPLLHLNNFLQGKCFHNQWEEENAFQDSSNPETRIFMLQEWTNLFLFDNIVLIIIFPILLNKDVFGPSYNDSKFTVKNHNYFFTNLIQV